MAELRVLIDDKAVQMALNALKVGTQNLEPAMKDIGEYYVARIDQRFEDEGPNWKALSPKYAKWKAAQPRAIQKILQFSGMLRASINYQASPTEVAIGSDKIYASRQEQDRPFLAPDDQDQQEFSAIVLDYLKKLSEPET